MGGRMYPKPTVTEHGAQDGSFRQVASKHPVLWRETPRRLQRGDGVEAPNAPTKQSRTPCRQRASSAAEPSAMALGNRASQPPNRGATQGLIRGKHCETQKPRHAVGDNRVTSTTARWRWQGSRLSRPRGETWAAISTPVRASQAGEGQSKPLRSESPHRLSPSPKPPAAGHPRPRGPLHNNKQAELQAHQQAPVLLAGAHDPRAATQPIERQALCSRTAMLR